MIRELTEKDFEHAVKNPHFEKLMTKVEVAITKDDWAKELRDIEQVLFSQTI